MKYFEKKSKTKRVLASLGLVFAVILSTAGIALASNATVMAANYISWETADVTYVDQSNEDYVLYEETADDGLTEVEGEVVATYASTNSYTFSWSVPNGHRYVTKYYSMSKGDKISVGVTTNKVDKTVKVGIVTPSGGYTYINVTGAGSYVFTCNTTGKYRVFVGNNSGTTVVVSGSYTLYKY